jgi:hypothetical protein
MVASATKKRKQPGLSSAMVVHVPLTAEQKEKLEQMAATDRRKHTDFIRILVDDEWDRRQKAAAGNGAAA